MSLVQSAEGAAGFLELLPKKAPGSIAAGGGILDKGAGAESGADCSS